MASQYINVYKGNPTAGQLDGSIVSTDGYLTSPIEVTVNTKTKEAQIIPLAVRCMAGWHAPNGCHISLTGDSKENWSLSLTKDGTFTETLDISDDISTTNILFFARVSVGEEMLKRDTSVVVKVEADIEAEA